MKFIEFVNQMNHQLGLNAYVEYGMTGKVSDYDNWYGFCVKVFLHHQNNYKPELTGGSDYLEWSAR